MYDVQVLRITFVALVLYVIRTYERMGGIDRFDDTEEVIPLLHDADGNIHFMTYHEYESRRIADAEKSMNSITGTFERRIARAVENVPNEALVNKWTIGTLVNKAREPWNYGVNLKKDKYTCPPVKPPPGAMKGGCLVM